MGHRNLVAQQQRQQPVYPPQWSDVYHASRSPSCDEEVRVRADAEAYVALYDTQAVRLHAYCWSLIGDQAASAVRDVFTAAAHPYLTGRDAKRQEAATPGRLWLYRQARAECLGRGPVTVIAGRDPLLRAAARLRADQREVLVLAADLPPAYIARVLRLP